MIEQPLHATLVDQQWLFVVRGYIWGEMLLAHGGNFFIAVLFVRKGFLARFGLFGTFAQTGTGLCRQTSPDGSN